MKMYGGVEILGIGTKYKWVVSFTPLPLYTRQRSTGTGDRVGPVEKNLTTAGIRILIKYLTN
jgi:hypothetical protein